MGFVDDDAEVVDLELAHGATRQVGAAVGALAETFVAHGAAHRRQRLDVDGDDVDVGGVADAEGPSGESGSSP